MLGKLTVITGPMFAGKTTRLIRETKKHKAIVFKPAMDTRYSRDECVTHTGKSITAISVSSPDDIDIEDHLTVIFDEIQFFTTDYFSGDIIKTISVLLNSGKNIIACGLDMDWQGNPFAITASLLAMADTIIKLKARCNICSEPAQRTYRKHPSIEVVELGHSDIYEARCHTHWPII